jgi:aryl-alcohol dehydrogenase-like predicted oxidoreductase
MACDWNLVRIGRTELASSAIGIASSYGIGGADLEHAFARGLNNFYYGAIRRPAYAKAVRGLARQNRERMVVTVQSFTRMASLMRPSLELGLRALGAEYADFLLLGWWNTKIPDRIMDAARKLRDRGRCRHILVSCHDRPTFELHARDPDISALMVRYNAAHPGAEREVFPVLGDNPPGVIAFTATSWGQLLNPALTAPGERTPRGSDCYRFVLSHPSVQVCYAGPKNRAELDEAIEALDRGPLSDDERAFMLRVGARVGAPATPAAKKASA